MTGLALVARRELRSQLRSKGFAVGLAISSLLIAALIVVPPLFGGDDRHLVGLAGTGSDSLAPALTEAAAAAGLDLSVVHEDEPAVREAVAEGELDLAVVDGRTILADGEPDEQLAALLQQVHASVTSQQRLLAAGLEPRELQQALAVEPLDVVSVTGQPEPDRGRWVVAFVIVLLLFFLIIGSASLVAMGVVEEKSSRIVEILLIAVRPWQLLGGKIAAFAVLGLIQLGVFAAVGLTAATAAGALPDLPGGTLWIVLTALIAFLFGFVFYAAVAAALASLVSRQEEVGHVLSPLTMAIVASYLVGAWAATNPDSTVSQVLSMTPPFAALVMPVRLTTTTVGPWEVAVAVAAMTAATAAVLAAGGRIYQRAVLRTGARIKLRDAWRSPRVASD